MTDSTPTKSAAGMAWCWLGATMTLTDLEQYIRIAGGLLGLFMGLVAFYQWLKSKKSNG